MDIFGKKISKISLGLSQLNNSLYTKKKFSDNYIQSFIEYSIDKGINCFDTANNYGETENILGKLKNSEKQKIIISSKAGFIDRKLRNFDQLYLEKEIGKSLKKLKTDSIDIFYLNKPNKTEIKKNHLVEFCQKMIEKGLIKTAGIIVGSESLQDYVYKDKSIKCFSFLYNLINNDFENDMKNSKKFGKFNFVRSPFNSGLLTNKFYENKNFPRGDHRFSFFSGENFKKKIDKVIYLKKIFKIPNNQVGNFSFNFLMCNQNVDSCYFGASKKNQVDELIKLSKKQEFFDEVKMLEIKKIIDFLSKKFKTTDQL